MNQLSWPLFASLVFQGPTVGPVSNWAALTFLSMTVFGAYLALTRLELAP